MSQGVRTRSLRHQRSTQTPPSLWKAIENVRSLIDVAEDEAEALAMLPKSAYALVIFDQNLLFESDCQNATISGQARKLSTLSRQLYRLKKKLTEWRQPKQIMFALAPRTTFSHAPPPFLAGREMSKFKREREDKHLEELRNRNF